MNYIYRNQLSESLAIPECGELDCLLVNTTGELRYFYREATVVFVGKSLTAKGGQNPIEPAALAKPIIFGPHMENFGDITARFLSNEAAVQVANEAELYEAIDLLLTDEKKRNDLGRAALKVVQENEGAAEKSVSMILAAI